MASLRGGGGVEVEKKLLRLGERGQTRRLETEEDGEDKIRSIADSWVYSTSTVGSVDEDESVRVGRTWLWADSAEGRAMSEFETTAWKPFGPLFFGLP